MAPAEDLMVSSDTFDRERLAFIVNDPKKAAALPPSLVAHIKMDLAAADNTKVGLPVGLQLQEKGITPTRQGAYQGNISNAAYNLIDPSLSYDAAEQVLQDKGPLGIMKEILFPHSNPKDVRTGPSTAPADAAWALYLGKPQPSKQFQVSPFAPSKSKESGVEYLRLNNFLPRVISYLSVPAGLSPSGMLKQLVGQLNGAPGHKMLATDGALGQFTLGQFTVASGHDEVGPYLSYYDKWDLAVYEASKVGKPFEIYDRMYYDPKTYTPIPEAEVLAKKAKLDLKSEENQQAIKAWLHQPAPTDRNMVPFLETK